MEARNESSEIFLTVDDFDVKYVGNEHVIHLVDALQQYYKISIDWDVNIYCGLTLDWDFFNVDISMTGYIQRTFIKFQQFNPKNI